MINRLDLLRVSALASLAVLVMASVVSCLPQPLSDPAFSRIDTDLTGYWLKEKDDPNQVTVVLMAPFDANAYLVHAVGYKKSQPQQKDHMVLKAWLTAVKGQRFLVMESDDHMLGSVGINRDKTYPTYRLDVKGEHITTHLLREGFEPFKDLKTSKQLAKVIADNLDNPKMYFHTEHWVRLSATKNKALIEEAMK